MLIRFFKNNNPSSFILLPLFALVLWIVGFFLDQNSAVKYSMPFYEALANSISNIPFLAVFIAFVLVIAEAFLLNYIVNENEILAKPSFLPALFYIVFMSNDSGMLLLHPLVFSNFFILLGIHKLVNSYRKDNAFSNAFDAGVFFSIATLFYFPAIVFLPLLGIGFILFRPFNWREWMITFLGVLMPYVFVFTYYFWNDTLISWLENKLLSRLDDQLNLYSSNSFYFILSAGWFIVLLSIGKLFGDHSDTSQKNKKGLLLLIWASLFALLSVFIAQEISIRSFSALAIPFSVFCANYFLKIKKKWWAELLFIFLLTSVFVNHLFNYF